MGSDWETRVDQDKGSQGNKQVTAYKQRDARSHEDAHADVLGCEGSPYKRSEIRSHLHVRGEFFRICIAVSNCEEEKLLHVKLDMNRYIGEQGVWWYWGKQATDRNVSAVVQRLEDGDLYL